MLIYSLIYSLIIWCRGLLGIKDKGFFEDLDEENKPGIDMARHRKVSGNCTLRELQVHASNLCDHFERINKRKRKPRCEVCLNYVPSEDPKEDSKKSNKSSKKNNE